MNLLEGPASQVLLVMSCGYFFPRCPSLQVKDLIIDGTWHVYPHSTGKAKWVSHVSYLPKILPQEPSTSRSRENSWSNPLPYPSWMTLLFLCALLNPPASNLPISKHSVLNINRLGMNESENVRGYISENAYVLAAMCFLAL